MALSNAERQKRYRERRKEQQPVIRYRRPADRRSRPQRWVNSNKGTKCDIHACAFTIAVR